MPETTEILSDEVAQLPRAERTDLVERIPDSLSRPDAALDALWANEAEDRLVAYRRGEISAVASSDVIAQCKGFAPTSGKPLHIR